MGGDDRLRALAYTAPDSMIGCPGLHRGGADFLAEIDTENMRFPTPISARKSLRFPYGKRARTEDVNG